MARKPDRIQIRLSEFDHASIDFYAVAKKHGGRNPTSSFVYYAIFQQMKRYPVSEAEKLYVEQQYPEIACALTKAQPEPRTGPIEQGTKEHTE